jgi:hypothetical protein
MNTKVSQLLADFRSEVPAPDEATADRIYRLVKTGPGRRPRLFVRSAVRPRLTVAIAVAALTVAGGTSALAYHYLGPSPGFTAGFAAFDNGAPAPWPASLPQVALDRSAAYEGVSSSEFLQRFRLLRTGLSLGSGQTRGQGQLYAYIGSDGRTACMFLTGQAGTCLNAQDAPNFQGVMPLIAPGYPGQTPALIGIVADNVASVDISLSGRITKVPIESNSIYADLTGLEPSDVVSLHITYGDGSTAVQSLPNPLSAQVTPQG